MTVYLRRVLIAAIGLLPITASGAPHTTFEPLVLLNDQRQVTDLARFVDAMRPWTFPPVVCGDFNAEPASEEIRMLTGLTTCPVENLVFHDAWAWAGGGGPGHTWDNANPYARDEFDPNRRLDYILVGRHQARGAGHIVECRVAGNEPVAGVWPSDHYAVLAELRY